jgi:hypothetical protein
MTQFQYIVPILIGLGATQNHFESEEDEKGHEDAGRREGERKKSLHERKSHSACVGCHCQTLLVATPCTKQFDDTC